MALARVKDDEQQFAFFVRKRRIELVGQLLAEAIDIFRPELPDRPFGLPARTYPYVSAYKQLRVP